MPMAASAASGISYPRCRCVSLSNVGGVPSLTARGEVARSATARTGVEVSSVAAGSAPHAMVGRDVAGGSGVLLGSTGAGGSGVSVGAGAEAPDAAGGWGLGAEDAGPGLGAGGWGLGVPSAVPSNDGEGAAGALVGMSATGKTVMVTWAVVSPLSLRAIKV